MADLNDLTTQEIGRRLRLARESAKVRQDEAAKVIGMSRPTLVSIEKGDRRVRVQELQLLTNHYGLSVNALLRREAVHTDLIPRFRRLRETNDDHVTEAVKLLNGLVKAAVELENTLGIEHQKNYPKARDIGPGDVVELAEQYAQELRDWLGCRSGPIADIFALMEMELGIRLFQRRLTSSKIAGLFTYDAAIGACMLLNASHPLERRVQSAAHELGHFVGTRQSPEVLEDGDQASSREERFASAFGRAFLTPRESFTYAFRQLTAGAETLTRRHVILLAHQYHISREACVRRLEELGLAKKGVWAWFEANGRITNDQARTVLGAVADKPDTTLLEADGLVPHRVGLMAFVAWKRGLLSEGQLAELLNVQRLDLRALLDQIDLEESETDDVFKLPR